MSELTRDSFLELVVSAISGINPQAEVMRRSGFEVSINGLSLGLDNLWRMVKANPSEAEGIISRYCEEVLVNAPAHAEGLESWVEMKPRIMPRIHPIALFERLDRSRVAYRPWVNDTVMTFVCDTPGFTFSLRREQIEEWRVDIDEIDTIATTNLGRYADLPDLVTTESGDGGKVVLVTLSDGYDSARILLPEMRQRFAEILGPMYYAGIPARDVLIGFSLGPPPFVKRVRGLLRDNFRRRPYPISPHPFLVTPDGIAGTMKKSLDDGTDDLMW